MKTFYADYNYTSILLMQHNSDFDLELHEAHYRAHHRAQYRPTTRPRAVQGPSQAQYTHHRALYSTGLTDIEELCVGGL